MCIIYERLFFCKKIILLERVPWQRKIPVQGQQKRHQSNIFECHSSVFAIAVFEQQNIQCGFYGTVLGIASHSLHLQENKKDHS